MSTCKPKFELGETVYVLGGHGIVKEIIYEINLRKGCVPTYNFVSNSSRYKESDRDFIPENEVFRDARVLLNQIIDTKRKEFNSEIERLNLLVASFNEGGRGCDVT